MHTQEIKRTIIEQLADRFAPRLKERRIEAIRLANTDALTGLANRRAFDLAEESATANGQMFIMFDLNNFGQINKQCGHSEGDRALKQFARQIETVAKNFKVRAFRYGNGDEFAIVCSQFFARRVRDRVERTAREIDYGNFTVSISGEVGFSIAEADSKLQARKAARKAR